MGEEAEVEHGAKPLAKLSTNTNWILQYKHGLPAVARHFGA